MKKFVVNQKFLFVVLLISLGLFLGSQLFLQTSFLSGDYRAQHVPWAVSLDRAVKSGTLPLWDPYTHLGFPMLAEGQMAALYPPTLLLYLIFPLKAAYAWGNVLHYILAIMWMYVFLRNAGLKDFSSAMGSLIFAFGSVSGGGYYNTISLKVLCWFPLTLFITDCYFRKRKLPYMLLLGGVFAWQVLAGYFQYALYSIIFSGLYFYYSSIIVSTKRKQAKNVIKSLSEDTVAFVIAGITALVIASPQIYETLKLISFCPRKGMDLGFALSGSFWPTGIITLFFPHFGGMPYVNGAIFVGIVPLSAALFIRKKTFNKQLTFLFILFFVSLVFALGRFSVPYKFILNAVNFYGFRVPSKFLFFSGFALSGICAFGISAFLDIPAGDKKIYKACNIWLIITISLMVFVIAGNIILYFKDFWLELGENYIVKYIYGKSYHKYSLEEYRSRLEPIYNSTREIISFNNIKIIVGMAFAVFAGIFIFFHRNKLVKLSTLKWVCLGLVSFELLLYNHYCKINTNLEPLDTFIQESEVADYLKKDKGFFRVYSFIDRNPAEIERALQILPNRAIIHRIFDVGCYTPLVMGSYYNFMGNLGSVDDSMGVPLSTLDVLSSESKILEALNVGYVVALAEIPFFQKVKEIGKVKIYRNSNSLPRCFLTDNVELMPGDEIREKIISVKKWNNPPEVFLNGNTDSFVELDGLKVDSHSVAAIQKYSPNEVKITTLNNAGKALLVLSELYYPGWKAVVNSVPAKIFRVNSLLRGVIVGPGESEIIMKYSPSWFFYLLAASIIGYCVVILLFLAFKFGWQKAFIYFSVVFAIIVFLFYLNVFIYSQAAGKV